MCRLDASFDQNISSSFTQRRRSHAKELKFLVPNVQTSVPDLATVVPNYETASPSVRLCTEAASEATLIRCEPLLFPSGI
jgi:hypothetical protein